MKINIFGEEYYLNSHISIVVSIIIDILLVLIVLDKK